MKGPRLAARLVNAWREEQSGKTRGYATRRGKGGARVERRLARKKKETAK